MRIYDMDFTIGADPELFVTKDGKPFSAHGLVKGNKRNPLPVEKGAVQVDGMALEFNIDPASTEEEFLTNIETVKAQLLNMVEGFSFSDQASVEFELEVLRAQPAEALALGCEPDYNARTGKVNHPPRSNSPMRTAGGHVHIGGFGVGSAQSKEHFDVCRRLTSFMDEQVGVYSVLWDKDDKRRSMYGKASCFRPKSYGMEYRTMSNAWIFKKELVQLVFNWTGDAIKQMFDDKRTDVGDNIYNIINNSIRTDEFFKGNAKADMVRDIVGA